MGCMYICGTVVEMMVGVKEGGRMEGSVSLTTSRHDYKTGLCKGMGGRGSVFVWKGRWL